MSQMHIPNIFISSAIKFPYYSTNMLMHVHVNDVPWKGHICANSKHSDQSAHLYRLTEVFPFSIYYLWILWNVRKRNVKTDQFEWLHRSIWVFTLCIIAKGSFSYIADHEYQIMILVVRKTYLQANSCICPNNWKPELSL